LTKLVEWGRRDQRRVRNPKRGEKENAEDEPVSVGYYRVKLVCCVQRERGKRRGKRRSHQSREKKKGEMLGSEHGARRWLSKERRKDLSQKITIKKEEKEERRGRQLVEK